LSQTPTLEKFDILNRFTRAVQVTAEISVTPDMTYSVKLGLAIRWAVKSGADLSGADLSGAYLSRADLSGADLSGADLSGAYLSRADLSGADLSGADLSGADLSRADLSGADLSRAYLSRADLSGADLSRAYLSGADLSRADLSRAYLSGAKNADLAIARTRILPDGALIGWKKCRNDVIVKLRIPEDAPRSHAYGRKCRAKFADVLEIFGADKAVSSHDPKFTYTVGERVEAANWCENWEEECAGGVHFFINRLEAEAYS
jgi:hypothetical protein